MKFTKQRRMKSIYTLCIIFLTTVVSYGQVTLAAPSLSVASNTFIKADIKLKGRDSITSLQFSLNWDSTVLEYVSVEGFGLPETSATENFGTTRTSSGQLAFLWDDKTVIGFPIKDSVTVYRVQFKIIGKSGMKSLLKFSDTPTKIKATNPKIAPITISTQDGMVSVGSTAVGEVFDSNISVKLYQNTPNPSHNFTLIPFELKNADTISLKIFDINGRQMYENKAFYSAGKHEFRLSTEGVFSAGTYIYSITTTQGMASRTMIIK